jgi:hypothetical protein
MISQVENSKDIPEIIIQFTIFQDKKGNMQILLSFLYVQKSIDEK